MIVSARWPLVNSVPVPWNFSPVVARVSEPISRMLRAPPGASGGAWMPSGRSGPLRLICPSYFA